MIPLKMIPEIKYPVWGGTKLRDYYHKNCTQDNAGESWEVSTHPSGLSIIANGEWKGMSLADAIKKIRDKSPLMIFPFYSKLLMQREIFPYRCILTMPLHNNTKTVLAEKQKCGM